MPEPMYQREMKFPGRCGGVNWGSFVGGDGVLEVRRGEERGEEQGDERSDELTRHLFIFG